MESVPNNLRRVENIPLLVAFLTSVAVVALDLFDPAPVDRVAQTTLIVLGAIALGLLAERIVFFERIERSISKMAPEPFLQVPNDWALFEGYANQADEICVSGGSLHKLTERNRVIFEKKLSSGCKLKVVLLDPDSPTLEAVALWAGLPPEKLRGDIESSLHFLKDLRAKSENIEVRLSAAIPAVTFLMFDGSKSNGKIRVGVQLFQCDPARRPFFELTRSPADPEEVSWFEDFRAQFERQWNEAEPYC